MGKFESATDNNVGIKQAKRGMGWCETYLRFLAARKGKIFGPPLEYCADYINSADDYIRKLESRLAQVERERDAAVHDLGRNWKCEICKKRREPINKCPYYTDCGLGYIHWEWRGVCDENTEEKP